MKLTEVSPDRLPQGPERAACKLARIAACDVYFGGARALVRVKRMTRSPHYHLYCDAVDNTYHHDYAPESTAWECPECGEACFGQTRAANHCAEMRSKLDSLDFVEIDIR